MPFQVFNDDYSQEELSGYIKVLSNFAFGGVKCEDCFWFHKNWKKATKKDIMLICNSPKHPHNDEGDPKFRKPRKVSPCEYYDPLTYSPEI